MVSYTYKVTDYVTCSAITPSVAPKVKKQEENMEYVDRLLDSSPSVNSDLTILVLPEMAFTGYEFSSKAELIPLSERAGEGKTFEWCRNQARR